MTKDNFWDNHEQAQKLIGESNEIRRKADPVLAAERQSRDLSETLELITLEPEEAHPPLIATFGSLPRTGCLLIGEHSVRG